MYNKNKNKNSKTKKGINNCEKKRERARIEYIKVHTTIRQFFG